MGPSAVLTTLLYFLGLVLWVFCVVDTLRRQREYLWVLLLLFAPPLGVILYLANFYVLEGAGWRRIDVVLKERSRMRQLERELVANKIPGHQRELAQIYLNRRRYADCVQTLKPALDEDPEDLRGQFMAGKALVGMNRPAEGIPHLEYVVQVDPYFDFGEALLMLGRAYESVGQPDQALAMYEKLFQKYRYAEGVVRRASLLVARGEIEAARQDLDQLLREAYAAPGFNRAVERVWLRTARALLRKLS